MHIQGQGILEGEVEGNRCTYSVNKLMRWGSMVNGCTYRGNESMKVKDIPIHGSRFVTDN